MKFLKILFTTLIFLALTSCHEESKTSVDAADSLQPATSQNTTPRPVKEHLCFLKALNKDSTFVNLTIDGNKVTGNMHWQPWEKDNAVGTLEGTKDVNGEMTLLYDYVIEGSRQTEPKIMKIENNQLKIKTGELIDPTHSGQLIFKDSTKLKYTEVLLSVACR